MTAFTSYHGLFRVVRMHFGLRISLSKFQRTTDVAFSTVRWQLAIVYLDDILVLSRSAEEHMHHFKHL